MTDEPVVSQPRLAREKTTILSMIRIYCRGRHGASADLCSTCDALHSYAMCRLDRCPFGADKPACAKCPIHCYKPAQREMAREVMRYAGPRMPMRHPWRALTHVFDKLRRVVHPMVLRRTRKS